MEKAFSPGSQAAEVDRSTLLAPGSRAVRATKKDLVSKNHPGSCSLNSSSMVNI